MSRMPYNSSEYWETKDRIFDRDKGRCQSPHCQNMPEWYLVNKQWELDHVIPISKGEGIADINGDWNLRVLCPFCHATRDDSNLEPTSYNSHFKLGLSYVLTKRIDSEILEKYRWRDEL